jgi:hypothetical protein
VVRLAPVLVVEGVEHAEDGGRLADRERMPPAGSRISGGNDIFDGVRGMEIATVVDDGVFDAVASVLDAAALQISATRRAEWPRRPISDSAASRIFRLASLVRPMAQNHDRPAPGCRRLRRPWTG